MRALLVTSRVTFVPRNYDDFVVGLASCPQVAGLLVLDNVDQRLVRRALGLLLGPARRVGWALLGSLLGPSRRRRERAYARAGKPVFRAASINAPAVADLVRHEGIDVVVNARTRQIFRKRILAIPRLGCLNVHHGLLPEQRGAMCDLWSLGERGPAGFSVHVMTPAIDSGPILTREQVSGGSDRDYLAYLVRSARRELAVVRDVLARIEAEDSVGGRANRTAGPIVPRRTPTRKELRALRRKGVRL